MKKVLLVANTRYTITHFRGELVDELRHKGYQVQMACPVGLDLDGTRVDATQVLPVRMDRKGINPAKDFKTIFDLLRIFRRERPDVVMNFTIKPVIYGSLVAGLFTRAKIFSNITGLGYVFTDPSPRARRLKAVVTFLYRIALSFNEKVFFQNPDDMDLFLKAKILPTSKAKRLFGSGISLERFLPPTRNRKVAQTFIFVGRLLRDKGLCELVEAMRVVKARFPQACCWVIGEPDPKNPNSFSEAQIESWREEGLIELLGRINDVRPYLEQAQVMVLPSYREGTPRSVLEAMAMGLPIITTEAPGCRETVPAQENGFLVPVKDHQILAQKMIYFLENPEAVERMGHASLHLAQEHFDVKKVNRDILQTMNLETLS